jgi:hypothetical protein
MEKSVFNNVRKASILAFVCSTLQEAYEATGNEYFIEQFTTNWNEGIKLVDALAFHRMITIHSKNVMEHMK